jgi:hypothetical protein
MRWDAVPEALFHKDASWNGVLEHFSHGIGFTMLVVSCYPTAFLSNKLAYFAQFLKEKLPPRTKPHFWSRCVTESISLEKWHWSEVF